MCGRYVVRGRKEQLAIALHLIDPLPFDEFTERPHFNIAPSQHVPVVRLDAGGTRVGAMLRWGVHPVSSGMFKQAFQRRRCLVPADGFYEWRKVEARTKQPMFMHFPDDRIFAFAGLWERWHPPGEQVEPVDTVTIVTTTPNTLMKPIHDRMPVIVPPEEYGRWLDPKADPAEAAQLMRPYADGELVATPVSKLVNSPKNDVPQCVEPLA